MGFVFQSFYLLPTLTAIENVQILCLKACREVPLNDVDAGELLERVGIGHR
ncbi:MAG: hypothetical protein R3C05_17935 [Pirellulaceae bacterium]